MYWVLLMTGNQKLSKPCVVLLCIPVLSCSHDRKPKSDQALCGTAVYSCIELFSDRKPKSVQALCGTAVYSCIELFSWQETKICPSSARYCCVFMYWIILMTGNQKLPKPCVLLLCIHVLSCYHDRKPKAVQAVCSTAVYSCTELFSWQETKSCPSPV